MVVLPCRAIQELKARGFLMGGQQVGIVQSGRQPIWRAASTHAIQVSFYTLKGQNLWPMQALHPASHPRRVALP